jgi:hypothetical protein
MCLVLSAFCLLLKSASTWHAKMIVFVFMSVVVAWRKSSSYIVVNMLEKTMPELTRGESRSGKSCTNFPELSIAQSSCRDLLRSHASNFLGRYLQRHILPCNVCFPLPSGSNELRMTCTSNMLLATERWSSNSQILI